MTTERAADQRLLDRFLDGELHGDELARCRRRCEEDPALRALLQHRRQLRAGFAAGAGDVFVPAPGFASRVLAAAHRLPEAGADEPEVASLCRRLLLVAAAAVLAALLWRSGLFAAAGGGTLEAAPDQVQRALDDLDARIRAEVQPR